jgi:hypothetical protein
MMIRALMDGTGLTYDDVRRMTCRQFWRRMEARNRWEMRKGRKEGKAEEEDPEELTADDIREARARFGG